MLLSKPSSMNGQRGLLIARFVKGISGFGSFALINQISAFLLVPIYWKYLDPSDYGVIGIFTIVVTVLSAIFTFGLSGTVERYYFEWDESLRQIKIRVLWYIQLFAMMIFALISHALFFFGWVSFDSVEYSPVVFIAITCSSFMAFQYIPFSILRVTQNIKLFGILSLLQFFMTALMTIGFLMISEVKLEGYLLAQFISTGLMAVIWVFVLDGRAGRAQWVNIKEELKFASPNLPLTAITRASEVVDKVILEKFLSLGTLGLYIVGNRFGGYFGSVNSVLKLAFYPLIYERIVKEGGEPDELTELSLFYVLLLSQLGLIVIVLFEGVVSWFGDGKFYGAFDYIPLFVVASFIGGMSSALGMGIELAKVPHKAFYAVIPSSASAIVLALLLIPQFGVYGGILTLIVSSFIKTSISIYLGYKYFPRRFPLLDLSIILLVNALVVWGISTYRIDSFSGVVLKILCVFLVSIVLAAIIYRDQMHLLIRIWRKKSDGNAE